MSKALYRNSYQRGFISILYSAGAKPLHIWETHIRDGYISRILDPELKALVLDIRGTNVSTTYMVCPKGHDVLGIAMPFLVMIVKNLNKYFTFEVTIVDQAGFRRRFRVANFQSTTKVSPSCTAMPISLSYGWNQIQFNLQDFTYKAYKQTFAEVLSVKVNANIRLRRIYFASTLVPDDELPTEYRLFRPISRKSFQKISENKENVPPSETTEETGDQFIKTHKEIKPVKPPAAPFPQARLVDMVDEAPLQKKSEEQPMAVEVESLQNEAVAEGPKVEAETQPGKVVSRTKSVTKQSRKTSKTSKSEMTASKLSQHQEVEEVPPVPATSKTSRGSKEFAEGTQESTGLDAKATRRSMETVGAENIEGTTAVETSSATRLPEGDMVKEEPEEPPNAAEDNTPAEVLQEDKPPEDTIVSPTASTQSH